MDGTTTIKTIRKRADDCLERAFRWLPARMSLAVMAFFGFINLYMVRINLSVAIVAMVGRSGKASNPAACHINVTDADFIDNSSIPLNSSTLTDTMQSVELVWSETVQGFVLGSFFYGYATTQIIGGRTAEVYGTRWVYGGSVLAGGVAALLTPAVARLHYGAFIALRIIQGALQGVSWPSMHALLSRWIPPQERSRFIGYVYFANTLSTAMTMPLCGLIIEWYGWPQVFYLTGSLSLLWCVVWFTFMYNSPAEHPRISQEELSYIESTTSKQGLTRNREEKRPPIPWWKILTSPPMWAIIICGIGSRWGISLFFGFLPTYMKNVLGFSIKQNSTLSALPFLCRYFGCVMWSSLADISTSRGYISLLTARRLASIICMWVPALMLVGLAFNGCGWQSAVTLMCVALFCNGALSAGAIVNHTDLAPNFSGTLFGLDNTICSIVAFVSPVVVGYIIDGQQTLGQWRKVFWTCVPMYAITEVFYLVFASVTVQPWNYPAQQHQHRPDIPAQEMESLVASPEEGHGEEKMKAVKKISQ